MATFKHTESRRLYSWWWDSHISPKNSKWLQENLSDMDMKVKAMIKLIEEDADSFARRAEMYYKKRPELMKLVEEFYRAYRALAERYDHATGALRQAHHTIAEAFPNQIPFVVSDESPSGSSGIEPEPHSPQTPRSSRMLFVADDSIKRNGVFSEESDVLKNKKGLNQLNETNGKLSEGSMTKGLDFKEEERYVNKTCNELQDLQKNDSGEKEDSADQIRCLQEEVSCLSKENQNLKDRVTSESVRADRAEAEVQSLKNSISKWESEKEAALLRYHPSLRRISNLEAEITRIHEEFKKQNNDMLMGLEEERCRLQEENETLNEQNLSSGLKIKNLQNEVVLHEEEKQTLQQELSCLHEHKIDLEEKHHGLTRQIDAVSSNAQSLQALVKELQDGNEQLEELCKKNEDEMALHLQDMEKISEKNAVLENSLSDANAELEGLREKIKALEASCESLHGKISVHLSEKAVLVSQIEAIAQNMEKISDKNTFLENSLSDVNVELEALRQKLKGLEDSYQSLSDQKSNLLVEKNALVSQVESINNSLENMGKNYSELEDKHSNLVEENELTLLQVKELQDSLKLERQEHEALIQSSNSELLLLENKINLLQEEGRLREEEFEVEQLKTMNEQIENLILQSCICDMKEKNMILSIECKKLLEKSRLAEDQISKLDQEHFLLQEKITTLSEQNEKLRKGVHLIMETLNVNKDGGFSNGSMDELLLHLIVCEIRSLLNTISDAQNENQLLLLENSVIITLLKQFGLDMTDLRQENYVLEKESKIKMEELAVLQNKKLELLEMNEQLMLDLDFSNQTEKVLKSEKEILCQKLSKMEETYCTLLEDNHSLSKKFYDMSEKKDALEQENIVILAKAMNLEHLYLIFKSYNAERTLDLKSLADDLNSLHKIRNDLDRRVRQMDERMGSLDLENVHLKDSIINLEDDLKRANLQIEMRNGLLEQKDMELSQANQRFRFLEDENIDLHNEVEELKGREEHLTSELKKGATELQKCEFEFAALLDDIQVAIVHATIFEEKILELLLACESLEIGALVQREMLLNEIASRNLCVDELKEMLSALKAENRGLKADLNAFLPLIVSLWESIAALEERTFSLAKHHASSNQEDQVDRNSQELSEDHNAPVLSGVLGLEKLLAKVEALRKMVTETESLLEKERSDSSANLAAAEKEIEVLKSERVSSKEKHDRDAKLQENSADISQAKDEQVMKDIPLDHVRSSPCGSAVSSVIPDVGNDDQMLELWEIAKGHGSGYHSVGAAKAERSNHPSSEIVLEKELSIDKLESPKKLTEPHQEWNKRVLERLASDAEKLSLLQMSVEELKRRIKSPELTNHPSSSELETVKAQTKEAEAAISQLIDFNNKLTKKAENFSGSTESLSTESLVSEHDETGTGNRSRRQIAERARRGAEKIGRLDLELRKMQDILLKLEEEHKHNRARVAGGRRRVVLRDYLYGRKDGRTEKKAPFCACMRPSTEFD